MDGSGYVWTRRNHQVDGNVNPRVLVDLLVSVSLFIAVITMLSVVVVWSNTTTVSDIRPEFLLAATPDRAM